VPDRDDDFKSPRIAAGRATAKKARHLFRHRGGSADDGSAQRRVDAIRDEPQGYCPLECCEGRYGQDIASGQEKGSGEALNVMKGDRAEGAVQYPRAVLLDRLMDPN